MKRREMMAGMVGGLLAVPHMASGQSPSTRKIPTRTGLAQLGLERHWFNAIPLASGSARVAALNLTGPYLFAQTTDGLVVCYNAETGQKLWATNLQTANINPAAVSANDRMAIAAVGQKVMGLEMKTGAKIWEAKLEQLASGGTAMNSDIAAVALKNGKVQIFNLRDPGIDKCGERHDPTKCNKLKPEVGRYLYAWQANKTITSRPFVAAASEMGKHAGFMIFASQDGKVYFATLDNPEKNQKHKIGWRVETKGPIRANFGFYGMNNIIVGSDDHKIYSIDIVDPEKAETNWIFPTSAPVDHDILVAGDDVYAVTKEGDLYSVNAKDGTENWILPIGKARILAISPTHIYGVTVDGGPAVVNRADGKVVVTPEQGIQSYGVDLKNYSTRMTNSQNDRIYMATEDGILLCLRELGKVAPTPVRDPNQPKFGTTPQEIYEMNQAKEEQEKGKAPAEAPAEPK